jgi:2-polyprenyl-3-methyl-5-hydroxy-6-metoxy-1,4-benzoquinol methylase
MIARRKLPARYRAWNRRWGAPFGRNVDPRRSLRQRLESPAAARYGPFAFQWNSLTRCFEYPWAFFAAELEPGMRVLEVGGGLSGMQFVLAREGCRVTNVDPSAEAEGWSHFGADWPLTRGNHRRLNETFGTDVRLVSARVEDAALPVRSFDRVFCLSVLEHVTPGQGRAMLKAIEGFLAPGGLCLLSVDLFLDLEPFGVLKRNPWGTNIDLHRLLSSVRLDLVAGDRRELLGFREFDRDRIVTLLPKLLVGFYPLVAQTLVLRKPQDLA